MDAFVKLIRSVGTASADAAADAAGPVAVSAKKQSQNEKREEKKKAKDKKTRSNESKIKSLRIQIGASISDAFGTAPSIQRKKGGKRRQSTDDGSISSVDGSLSSSISSRRRKTSMKSIASDEASLESMEQTPRRGGKKKRSKSSATSAPSSATSAPSSILVLKGSRTPAQSRQEYHRPTTDFMGWRRLRLHELVSLEIGDSFMLIVPGDAQREDELLKRSRADLRFRLLRHVKPFFERETRGVEEDSMFETLSLLMNERHGIRRNKSTHIELHCVVASYPHRDDYLYECLDEADMKDHIKKGAGIELSLVEYPGDTLLLKWKEAQSVLAFVEMHHGDECEQIALPTRSAFHLYCDDFGSIYDEIKGDPIQEILLANEVLKKEVRHLAIQTSKATKAAKAQADSADDFDAALKLELELELDGGSLAAFANRTDNKFKKAWIQHYSYPFQDLSRLIGSDDVTDSIAEDIRTSFPKHYAVLESLFFSKRSHEPANKAKPSYKERMRSLTTHFLAIVRVRNPRHLMHWAITGTMAMFHAGIPGRLTGTLQINELIGFTTFTHTSLSKTVQESFDKRVFNRSEYCLQVSRQDI